MRFAALFALALPLAAQPQMENAKLETRAASGGLKAEVDRLAASGSPLWVAYAIPSDATFGGNCEWNGNNVMYLEPPGTMYVLARLDGGKVQKVRSASPRCKLDGGGMRVVWLTGVTPTESVSFLESTESGQRLLHYQAGAEATDALLRLAKSNDTKLRSQALSWATQKDPARTVPLLIDLAKNSKDNNTRRDAMRRLGQTNDPRARQFMEEVLK